MQKEITNYPSMTRKFLFGIIGILITNIILTIIDVVQGLILDDWSGLHPMYRAFQLPIAIGISFIIGLFILVIFYLFKLKPIKTTNAFFKIGLLLGLVKFGSVIRPWIMKFPHDIDIITILLVFIISLIVSIWLSIRKTE